MRHKPEAFTTDDAEDIIEAFPGVWHLRMANRDLNAFNKCFLARADEVECLVHEACGHDGVHSFNGKSILQCNRAEIMYKTRGIYERCLKNGERLDTMSPDLQWYHVAVEGLEVARGYIKDWPEDNGPQPSTLDELVAAQHVAKPPRDRRLRRVRSYPSSDTSSPRD